MYFHTWPFLVFFLIVYGGYLLLRRTSYWLPWLLAASYFFYAWWNALYLILILYSTLLDFACVAWMDGSQRRRFWLAVSIANNLFLLGFFKYAEFVTENINRLLLQLGITTLLPEPDILLPVGISFFTFQSMSYTIDFYRGEIERERSWIRFATYVSFFPQLVAGPIERAKTLLPQLTTPRAVGFRQFTEGLNLFVVGLFKKIALADYLGTYVDPIYAVPENYGAPALLGATFAFAWQIYFDFSGYTDMARGVARAMGFDLMRNFSHPYLAMSLTDFWSRWHISLSTWFRDYLYFPLGGNRYGPLRTYRNLWLTMIISGIWHGAAWTFLIWGALHGLAAVTTRAAERSSWYRDQVPRFAKQVAVFLFVCFAWIFFRAASLDEACYIVRQIATAGWYDPAMPLLALGMVAAIWIYQLLCEHRQLERLVRQPAVQIALACAMLLYLCIVPSAGEQAFIYFQF